MNSYVWYFASYMNVSCIWICSLNAGTMAAAPPPFRPSDPALCGSHPLVTPYYCRLGDLQCFLFMSAYCMFDFSVYSLFLQYFDTVGWVF